MDRIIQMYWDGELSWYEAIYILCHKFGLTIVEAADRLRKGK